VPTISERIQALDEKEKQIRAKKELLINKAEQESRRVRNRQNIVAGALLIELAFSGPEEARRFISAFEKRLTRDQDKKTMAPVLEELRAVAAGKPVSNT
jgi:hypothetical protein